MSRAERVDVWMAPLDQPAWRLDRLGAALSAAERRRADRLADPGRRRWIAARGILRAILAASTGLEPGELDLDASPSGKPKLRLPGRAAAPHFSCSHSGAVALYAVAWGGPVGVDLEALRPVPDGLEVARRLLPAEACRELEALAPGHRATAFLAWWTRMEARLKARGTGWGGGDGDLASAVADGSWSTRDLRLRGHVAAVAARGDDWHATLREWEG